MYGCPGYDTYGPFKLVGGMNKERPNQEDCDGVVEFFDHVIEDYTEAILADRARRDKQDAFNAAHPTGGLMSDIKHSAKKIAKRFKKKPAHPTGGLMSDIKHSAKKIAKRFKKKPPEETVGTSQSPAGPTDGAAGRDDAAEAPGSKE